jgi:hypothetical protein
MACTLVRWQSLNIRRRSGCRFDCWLPSQVLQPRIPGRTGFAEYTRLRHPRRHPMCLLHRQQEAPGRPHNRFPLHKRHTQLALWTLPLLSAPCQRRTDLSECKRNDCLRLNTCRQRRPCTGDRCATLRRSRHRRPPCSPSILRKMQRFQRSRTCRCRKPNKAGLRLPMACFLRNRRWDTRSRANTRCGSFHCYKFPLRNQDRCGRLLRYLLPRCTGLRHIPSRPRRMRRSSLTRTIRWRSRYKRDQVRLNLPPRPAGQQRSSSLAHRPSRSCRHGPRFPQHRRRAAHHHRRKNCQWHRLRKPAWSLRCRRLFVRYRADTACWLHRPTDSYPRCWCRRGTLRRRGSWLNWVRCQHRCQQHNPTSVRSFLRSLWTRNIHFDSPCTSGRSSLSRVR